MSKEVIILDEETVTKLKRAHYDYENYKDIIASCLDLHKLDDDDSFISSAIFQGYQNKMREAFAAYNELKGDLERKHNLQNKSWNLDFSTGELTRN